MTVKNDINKPVAHLRDNYYQLSEEVHQQLDLFISQLQYKNKTTQQITEEFKNKTNINVSENVIKYSMLLHSILPENMHTTHWLFK